MAVKHLRIDNRLIHGQVTSSWVGNIGADHIIVTNDEVANDPIQQTMLPEAARGVKTSVFSVEETVEYMESEESEDEVIMIIAKFPEDALQLLKKGIEPAEINMGNQAPIPNTDPVKVTRSIAITKEQGEKLREISNMGYKLTSQMMPSDNKKDFIKMMEKKGI